MNIKRLLLAIVAGFVVMFATDFLIHHIWLMPDYNATKQLWRPESEMRICWIFFAEFLCAAAFVLVWAKGFAGRGLGAAITFGLLMGLFQGIWPIMNWVVMPMPGELAAKWFLAGLAQAVLLGLVTSLVYKPTPSPGA